MKHCILLLCISLASCNPAPNATHEWVAYTEPADSRLTVVERRLINGYALTVFADKKTGVEYLLFDHGLTRLESTATK